MVRPGRSLQPQPSEESDFLSSDLITHSCVCTFVRLQTRVCVGGKMQSIGLSRGFFGCTHSSLLTAAMVVGTLVLAGKVSAPDQPSPSTPASIPQSPTMA